MAGPTRILSAALLALHLFAFVGVSLADEWGGSEHTRPHLAAEAGDDCAPPHDHLCQLCRTARTLAVVATVSAAFAAHSTIIPGVAAAPPAATSALRLDANHSRAPPSV